MSLGKLIEHHPSDRTALVDGELSLTYGELRDRVAAMRAHLTDRGVGPGDHIVLLCGNEAHFVTAALGALGVGAVAAPVNPFSPQAEIERKLPSLRPVLAVVGESAASVTGMEAIAGVPVLDMADVPLGVEDAPPPVEVETADPAFLLSTSGVSGVPKVAMLSHDSLAAVQQVICGDGPESVRSDDVVLASLPLAHVLGLNVVLLSSLRAGATVVFQRRFDADEALDLMERYGVTMLTGAPPMWKRWAETDRATEAFAHIRFARSGAASLPNDVHERLVARYGLDVRQGYGLTETSSAVTTGRNLRPPKGSVGKPLPGIEFVLVDEEGEPVDDGDVGEIVVRGPGVFLGYLDDQDATDAILAPDGWLWTGDVGLFDDDGYLHLVDRVKDIIIVSGFNVYPAEVENVLMQHPGVRGAVVVGSDHAETGETVVAHVSGDVREDELRAFARSQLGGYKVPTVFHFVDELPVASTGKAIRRELRS
ncbi:MAG: AMP-binding protein [Actinomycetota bacterium]